LLLALVDSCNQVTMLGFLLGLVFDTAVAVVVVIMGYPGVRLEASGELSVTPRCPEAVTHMKIRGLQYLGNSLDVEYACDEATSRIPKELTVTVTKQTVVQAGNKKAAPVKSLAAKAKVAGTTASLKDDVVKVQIGDANEKVVISPAAKPCHH
jgi:hypothetical protein